ALSRVAVAISPIIILSVVAASPAPAQRAPAPYIDRITFQDGRTCLELDAGPLPAMLVWGRQFGQGFDHGNVLVASPPDGRDLAVVGNGQHSHFRFMGWDRTIIYIKDFWNVVSGTPLRRGLQYSVVIERSDHNKRLSNLKSFRTCP